MLSRMTTKKTTTTIEVTTEVKSALEEQAKTSGRTVAEIVEALLARQRELDEDEAAFEAEVQAEHEAGLRSIEEEGEVEHEQMVEWARSLRTKNPLPAPTPRHLKD
jgi:predicted transcriptional regulator